MAFLYFNKTSCWSKRGGPGLSSSSTVSVVWTAYETSAWTTFLRKCLHSSTPTRSQVTRPVSGEKIGGPNRIEGQQQRGSDITQEEETMTEARRRKPDTQFVWFPQIS